MTARTRTRGRWPSLRPALAALIATASLVLALPAPSLAQPGRELPDFTELVERVGPSVVNIRTTERARASQGAGPQMDEDMQEFFRRFFGVPMPGQPMPRQDPRRGSKPAPEEEQPRGVGSGFILTADGFVMTNAHVVEGADEVYVTLTDKREFKAKIVGADKRTDVAVVKIDAAGLPAVRIADVGKLKVGEWVMAIGSPFGLDNTVTAGIVSAKQRDTGDYLPFIQTDVAINPGNSGGPLLNLRGEVVGINSQIYSRSGGFMGISFAIPIDEAMRVADQLRATGRVIRGRIGVQIDQVTKEVAESIGLGKPIGAVVRSVEPGGPAEKAGVEAGDIITRFDGKPIERAADLPRIVGNSKPGSKLGLQVFRRGSYRDLTVLVAEFEQDRPRRASAGEPRSSSPGAGAATQSIGLVVSELTEAQQRELNLRGGVRVDAAEGVAARAGLREGDVILAVANTEIKDARQFEAVLARMDRSKPFNILFRRGEWAQYAVIRPAR
ncbi:DegQ family serine endoprotease [Eleftheria terrae]|uniref:DegQ family serine endoprotease n=1 Tax=Eleftheria terrae TaxID=1597781 RepID=UPI00263ADDFA|nr:DegQ family serine endoprotease [Eleftheria terrae]WKB54585.1 DegQ family serine endoprotease [Eleftheria terrae]